MPNPNSTFGGSQLILPGAYLQTNVNNVLSANLFPGLPLIFIGVGYGGVPNTPYSFSDPNALKAFLRGSTSTRFVDFMANPSGAVPGAQNFVYINPAPNIAASATLYSSAATAVINISSVNYGSPGNIMTYSVATGSVAGINLTISDPQYTQQSFIGYNLGVPFQLTYTGTATAVKLNVTTVGGSATTFAISGGNAGENVTYDLTSSAYSNVGKIITSLNGIGSYRATLLSNSNLPSYLLDTESSVSLPITTAVNVTATLGDITYFLNTAASSLVSGSIPTGITSVPTLIPAPIGPANFTGGSNVSPTSTNYASAFNAALNVQGWVVFADSSSPAIQSLGQAHVNTASSITSKGWRRFVTGSNLGDSVSITVQNSQELNAINCTYCYPGIIANDPTSGLPVTYSGLYTAAAVAGMMAGSPFALPLTNKSLNASGMEVNLTISQINTLQMGGVLPVTLSTVTNTPTIISDMTTWQNDNNPENIFNQQIACRYALSYTLTNALTPYIGQVASTQSMTRVQNAIVRALNASIYSDSSQQGVLNSWDPSTLTLTYDGTTQTLTVSVSVSFVGQYRFINMTVSVNPLSLTNIQQNS